MQAFAWAASITVWSLVLVAIVIMAVVVAVAATSMQGVALPRWGDVDVDV